VAGSREPRERNATPGAPPPQSPAVATLREITDAADPALAPHALDDPGPPRFDGVPGTRGFVLEAAYEGYLMHYGTPRAFEGMDDDLRLLAGDALYALGLSRLAEGGDVEAVAELSDLISLAAQAHADGRPELADELWEASARALSSAGGPGARAVLGGRL
jgi:hypothetical protein